MKAESVQPQGHRAPAPRQRAAVQLGDQDRARDRGQRGQTQVGAWQPGAIGQKAQDRAGDKAEQDQRQRHIDQ